MLSIEDYRIAVEFLKPALWLSLTILVVSIWNLFFPKLKELTPVLSLIGLAAAGVTLCQQFSPQATTLFGWVYTVDKLTVLFGVLAVVVGIIVVLMTMGYEMHLEPNAGEFYTILLVATLSVMILAGATDLILLFVGLETLSISSVLLTGFSKRDRRSNEAALKYLLSTAATTATLLYGLSFLYGLTASTSYYDIHAKLASLTQTPSLVVIFLMMLVLSAVGFKLSAVPFHMWTPDVFEGAPTPVTAFLSIGSKAGGFVVAIRLLSFVFASSQADWAVIVGLLAMASMVAGNLIALAQGSFKRMLAYSSIAHVGYMLIGIVANTLDGLSAVNFYLIVYGLMNLGAFTGAIMFSNETGTDRIDDYAGLFRKRPWLATGIAICLINLAGLPIPPAGFFAKAFIFWSGLAMASPLGYALVGVALVTSVPAIYYYMRVAIKMVVREPSEAVKQLPDGRKQMASSQSGPIVALALCVAGILLGSITVNPIMGVAREAVAPITNPPALGMVSPR